MCKKNIYIISLIFMISCDKNKVEQTTSSNEISSDYRNKYVGKWQFAVQREEHNTDSIGYHSYDEVSYLGEIKLGIYSDEILIRYTNDDSIVLTVDKNDSISGFPSNYSFGEFIAENQLKSYLRWGGLGEYVVHYLDGEKK